MNKYRKILSAVSIALGSLFPAHGQIVINEVSQGPAGSQEYVEFLVIGTSCSSPCLDLRLWIFDDNNGYLNGGPTGGVGIADGACRFANDVFWSCIPPGTHITIYNDGDQNPSMPPDDISMIDGNCSLIIPISSSLFDHHPDEPSSTSSTYITTGWLPLGVWADISMANNQDGFQIYDPANLTTPVFSLGWGALNNNGDIWMGTGSASDDVFYADNGVDCDFTIQGNWAEGCAGDIITCGSDDGTPGVANSAGNTFCISQFNSGCASTGTLVIDTITSVSANCGGCVGTATATVSGGVAPYTYLWSDPAAQTNSTAASLCTGTFTVTVTDATGCWDTLRSVIITGTVAVNSSITNSTNLSCSGACIGTATVTASNGLPPYTYAWNDPSTQSSAIAVGLCAGNYVVTVTDANGCTDTSLASIVGSLGLILIPDSSAATCGVSDGEAWVVVMGGTAPYTYMWNDVGTQTTDTAFGLSNGIYQVIVTGAGGCIDSVSVTIVDDGAPTVSVLSNTNVACAGDSSAIVTLSVGGGTAPFTYAWNDPNFQTTAVATGLSIGVYSAIITDAVGCSTSITIPITEPNPIVLGLGSVDLTCGGLCDGQASVTVSGGETPYSYVWNDPGLQSNSLAAGLCAGMATVVVTDSNNCLSTDSILVNGSGAPIPTISSSTDVLCNGDSTGSATVSAIGGLPPYTYLWDDPLAQTGTTATGLPAGSYVVLVFGADGCAYNSIVAITEPPAIQLTTGSQPTNCGVATGIAYVTVTGGSGPYTYLWDDPLAQTNDSAVTLFAGNYMVLVIDSLACWETAVVNVIDLSGFVIQSMDTIDVSCNGVADGEATVTIGGGSAPFTYLWNVATGSQTSSTAVNLSPGIYSVTVTDGGGCILTGSYEITEPLVLTASITSSSNLNCYGDCDGDATVTGTGGTSPYSYLWNDPLAQTSFMSIGLCVGPYDAIITDARGCTQQASVVLTGPAKIETTLICTESSCAGVCDGTIQATTTGDFPLFTYLFDDPGSQTSSLATGLCPNTYTVVTTDNNGCTDTMTCQVNLNPLAPIALFTSSADSGALIGGDIGFISSSLPDTSLVQHLWNFGDGSTDSIASPIHAYEDTGTYIIWMAVSDGICTDTLYDTIWVDEIIDYIIFAPNSFSPNGDGLNDFFFPQGIGISDSRYTLMIFNRWGDQIFESNNLFNQWDGRANNGSDIAQEDVYVWILHTRETSRGVIHEYVGHVSIIR